MCVCVCVWGGGGGGGWVCVQALINLHTASLEGKHIKQFEVEFF